jgi:hypothetical protein
LFYRSICRKFKSHSLGLLDSNVIVGFFWDLSHDISQCQNFQDPMLIFIVKCESAHYTRLVSRACACACEGIRGMVAEMLMLDPTGFSSSNITSDLTTSVAVAVALTVIGASFEGGPWPIEDASL